MLWSVNFLFVGVAYTRRNKLASGASQSGYADYWVWIVQCAMNIMNFYLYCVALAALNIVCPHWRAMQLLIYEICNVVKTKRKILRCAICCYRARVQINDTVVCLAMKTARWGFGMYPRLAYACCTRRQLLTYLALIVRRGIVTRVTLTPMTSGLRSRRFCLALIFKCLDMFYL